MIEAKYSFIRVLIICIVTHLLFSLNANTQSIAKQYVFFDSKYEKNQLLYQGELYMANKRCDFGNPFLFTTDAQVSKIKYGNNIYTNLLLKYNVSNQRLLLVYNDNIGAERQIMLDEKKIDWFYLEDKYFVKNRYASIKEEFYEDIECINDIKCILSYKKKYGFENRPGNPGFGYSKLISKKYLLIKGIPVSFTSKKDFLKLLPHNIQPVAKNYIKKKRVGFKKWNGYQLKMLFDFLNSYELPNNE